MILAEDVCALQVLKVTDVRSGVVETGLILSKYTGIFLSH